MKYTVVMNGGYMNRFATYGEAREFADWLRVRYPMGKVEILAD